MEFVILGRTALRHDGLSVPLGAAKQRGLLAILLYHIREPVRIDAIVEHLWDAPPRAEHRANLYVLASRTRAALHTAGLGNALIRVPTMPAYRLDIDPERVDYHHFRHLVSSARALTRQGKRGAAVERLREAIGLWTDEPLADLHSARADDLRHRMTDDLLVAQKLLIDGLLRLGRHDDAYALLERLVPLHELDEAIAQYWVSALVAIGRADEARMFCRTFRRRFRREVHVEPDVRVPEELPSHLGADRRTPPPYEPPHQLPRDITDFLGHEDLLAELDHLTEPGQQGANVVIISGMPGVGKTTLAVHWAHRQRLRFPDGALFIDANGYGPTAQLDPAEGLARFLDALDSNAEHLPPEGEQRRARFNRLLTGRRAIIVLDNIGEADQARPLIPTSSTCVTLITSRSKLASLTVRDGLRRITVPPLSEQESVSLLHRIIGPYRPHNELAETRVLARFSAGLPLALRVIADHVADRPRASVRDLEEDLEAFLLGADDAGDDSLGGLFGWSYTRLTAPTARMFWLLGLHPGTTVSTEAAATLAGIDSYEAHGLLTTLARASLVNHDIARRYRFHDLLRQYAANRARREEPGLTANALRRLIVWYTRTAANATAVLAPYLDSVPDLPAAADVEPLTFLTEDEAMAWYVAERENIGHVTRSALANNFPRLAWQLPNVANEILERFGPQDDRIALLTIAVEAARLDQHWDGLSGSTSNLGAAYFAVHNYPRAAASFEAGMNLARDAGSLETERICSINASAIYLRMGDRQRAIDVCQRTLAICQEVPDPQTESAALHRLGVARRWGGEYEQAQEDYERALAIREAAGMRRAEATTLTELAALHLERRQLEAADERCRHALAVYRQTKDDGGNADATTVMADVRLALGEYDAAIRFAHEARRISEEINDLRRQARAQAVLADALVAAGHRQTAARVCAEALVALSEVRDPDANAVRARLAATADSIV